jgi:hypothetical protein
MPFSLIWSEEKPAFGTALLRIVLPVRQHRRLREAVMNHQSVSAGRVRVGVGSVEGFRAAMAAVDIEGWDGTVGRAVLRYARSEVVVAAVNARRLAGPSRDDAIATGWAAAWSAATTRAVRDASSPWGAVRAAVERAIGGSYVADRFGTSVRTGWRRVSAGEAAPIVVPAEPLSMERAVEQRTDHISVPSAAERLGRRLGWIRDALVVGGWTAVVAEDALVWVSTNYVNSAHGARLGVVK